ncbi:HAD family hydrolase [Ornithinibacillus salinisoli]|uniref:Phosphoserine phosphatase n=1 Tax=Ornithinibacillus salinisoli TaxID=1848459 RepID=A0ABW4VX69_9BACI
MINTIIFDLDDTLLWDEKSVAEAFKKTCAIAEKTYGIDPYLLEDKVKDNARSLYASYDTFEFTKKIGINPLEGLWGEFHDEGDSFHKLRDIAPNYKKEAWTRGLLDVGIDDNHIATELAERFPQERRNNPFVFDDTFQVLHQLKEDYQLLLLTNGSPDLQRTKLELTPNLQDFFNHVVISGDFGSGKPDPAIFEYALSLLSVDKDEAIMVGDNLHTDILGATRTGIKSVWVNRKKNEQPENVSPSYEITGLEDILTII